MSSTNEIQHRGNVNYAERGWDAKDARLAFEDRRSLLDEVDRLRAELKEYNDLSPIVTKLAKARAALKQMDCDCVLEMSPPEDHVKHDELCNYRIARQTLKEIDE